MRARACVAPCPLPRPALRPALRRAARATPWRTVPRPNPFLARRSGRPRPDARSAAARPRAADYSLGALTADSWRRAARAGHCSARARPPARQPRAKLARSFSYSARPEASWWPPVPRSLGTQPPCCTCAHAGVFLASSRDCAPGERVRTRAVTGTRQQDLFRACVFLASSRDRAPGQGAQAVATLDERACLTSSPASRRRSGQPGQRAKGHRRSAASGRFTPSVRRARHTVPHHSTARARARHARRIRFHPNRRKPPFVRIRVVPPNSDHTFVRARPNLPEKGTKWQLKIAP